MSARPPAGADGREEPGGLRPHRAVARPGQEVTLHVGARELTYWSTSARLGPGDPVAGRSTWAPPRATSGCRPAPTSPGAMARRTRTRRTTTTALRAICRARGGRAPPQYWESVSGSPDLRASPNARMSLGRKVVPHPPDLSSSSVCSRRPPTSTVSWRCLPFALQQKLSRPAACPTEQLGARHAEGPLFSAQTLSMTGRWHSPFGSGPAYASQTVAKDDRKPHAARRASTMHRHDLGRRDLPTRKERGRCFRNRLIGGVFPPEASLLRWTRLRSLARRPPGSRYPAGSGSLSPLRYAMAEEGRL